MMMYQLPIDMMTRIASVILGDDVAALPQRFEAVGVVDDLGRRGYRSDWRRRRRCGAGAAWLAGGAAGAGWRRGLRLSLLPFAEATAEAGGERAAPRPDGQTGSSSTAASPGEWLLVVQASGKRFWG